MTQYPFLRTKRKLQGARNAHVLGATGGEGNPYRRYEGAVHCLARHGGGVGEQRFQRSRPRVPLQGLWRVSTLAEPKFHPGGRYDGGAKNFQCSRKAALHDKRSSHGDGEGGARANAGKRPGVPNGTGAGGGGEGGRGAALGGEVGAAVTGASDVEPDEAHGTEAGSADERAVGVGRRGPDAEGRGDECLRAGPGGAAGAEPAFRGTGVGPGPSHRDDAGGLEGSRPARGAELASHLAGADYTGGSDWPHLRGGARRGMWSWWRRSTTSTTGGGRGR